MTCYRFATERDRKKGLRSDYWSSNLFEDMKTSKGLFGLDTDIVFMLSTDVVKVFKSRQSVSIWLLLLVLSPRAKMSVLNKFKLGWSKSIPRNQIQETEHASSQSHSGPQQLQGPGVLSFPVGPGVPTVGEGGSRCLEQF